MTRLILFRPEAEAEMEHAYQWYEERREGLGADFLLCVEESLDKIRRDPELYPAVHENVRRVLIRRFPFGVFYLPRSKGLLSLLCSRAVAIPNSGNLGPDTAPLAYPRKPPA